jgi:hypothetical protein
MVKPIKEPTELEKELYEALANVMDHIGNPLELTPMGNIIVRFSPEDADKLLAAYNLFTVMYGKKLLQGKYVEADTYTPGQEVSVVAQAIGRAFIPRITGGEK